MSSCICVLGVEYERLYIRVLWVEYERSVMYVCEGYSISVYIY